jgi:hypothetical protein
LSPARRAALHAYSGLSSAIWAASGFNLTAFDDWNGWNLTDSPVDTIFQELFLNLILFWGEFPDLNPDLKLIWDVLSERLYTWSVLTLF